MLRSFLAIVFLASFGAAADYTETIRAWQKHRVDGLRKPDSWLTLVGLFWLKNGVNTIGSGSGNDFVLPKKSAPARLGAFRLEGTKVSYLPAGGKSQILRYPENDDGGEKPDIASAGALSFYVIKRGDRLAIRVKDSESAVLKNFTGLGFFPINPQLHFQAKFIPDEKKIPILDVNGRTALQLSPGHVEFTYRNKTYSLRPIFEGKTLFFLFKDSTNRLNTYQAGRMLNTPQAVNGVVDLDFNRAYNPPCTFTPYATCPLPPKENRLPFAIEAGEKRYSKGHPETGTERTSHQTRLQAKGELQGTWPHLACLLCAIPQK